MSVARVYFMSSQASDAGAMETALLQLARGVRGIDGCQSVEVLHDEEQIGRFLFVENWASREKHAEGSDKVPGAEMRAVMDLMAGKPEAGWFARCD